MTTFESIEQAWIPGMVRGVLHERCSLRSIEEMQDEDPLHVHGITSKGDIDGISDLIAKKLAVATGINLKRSQDAFSSWLDKHLLSAGGEPKKLTVFDLSHAATRAMSILNRMKPQRQKPTLPLPKLSDFSIIVPPSVDLPPRLIL